MTKDLADFLGSLNSEGVVYVVIGGMAVLSHVPYRTTRDLDVLIEPTLDKEAVGRPDKDVPDLKRLRRLRGAD